MDLMIGQLLKLSEVCKILVICDDHDKICGSQEVVMPFLEGGYDGK